mmetsp:Transcript_21611/g.50719  ORF Transcript_21611/g.50719 Transcript_21611/m.50719 type:complete len:208 (-) Transcript_21611:1208-1831(-)
MRFVGMSAGRLSLPGDPMMLLNRLFLFCAKSRGALVDDKLLNKAFCVDCGFGLFVSRYCSRFLLSSCFSLEPVRVTEFFEPLRMIGSFNWSLVTLVLDAIFRRTDKGSQSSAFSPKLSRVNSGTLNQNMTPPSSFSGSSQSDDSNPYSPLSEVMSVANELRPMLESVSFVRVKLKRYLYSSSGTGLPVSIHSKKIFPGSSLLTRILK